MSSLRTQRGRDEWKVRKHKEKSERRSNKKSYRHREKEDKDDSWPRTLCIWQGWLVEP